MTRFVLILITIVFVGTPRAGAQEWFLQLPGVSGAATNAAQGGWIRLLHAETAVENPDKSSFAPLTLQKETDRTTPHLAHHCAVQTRFPHAVVEATVLTPTNQRLFQVIVSNVVVSSFSASGAGGRPQETMQLQYSALVWRYTERPVGAPARDHAIRWNAYTGGGYVDEPLTISGVNLTGTNFHLSWLAEQGKAYRVLVSDAITGPYHPLHTVTLSFNGYFATNYPTAPGCRFFRVERVQ